MEKENSLIHCDNFTLGRDYIYIPGNENRAEETNLVFCN